MKYRQKPRFCKSKLIKSVKYCLILCLFVSGQLLANDSLSLAQNKQKSSTFSEEYEKFRKENPERSKEVADLKKAEESVPKIQSKNKTHPLLESLALGTGGLIGALAGTTAGILIGMLSFDALYTFFPLSLLVGVIIGYTLSWWLVSEHSLLSYGKNIIGAFLAAIIGAISSAGLSIVISIVAFIAFLKQMQEDGSSSNPGAGGIFIIGPFVAFLFILASTTVGTAIFGALGLGAVPLYGFISKKDEE